MQQEGSPSELPIAIKGSSNNSSSAFQQQQQQRLYNYCDESKCVSRGKSDLFEDSFTCYGNNNNDLPMMCADGFLPVPLLQDETEESDLWYFTCCTNTATTVNTTTATTAARRHCSDPISVPSDQDLALVCETQQQQSNNNNNTSSSSPFLYPRRMKVYTPSLFYLENGIGSLFTITTVESFLCCDETHVQNNNKNNDTVDLLLDDLECVPYHNRFYDASRVRPNQVGSLSVMACDLPDFPFAKPTNTATNNTNSNTNNFQCCKTGTSLPPFVHDATFRATVYPILVCYCIAAVVSAIVGLGLSIPLLIQRNNNNNNNNNNNSSQWRALAVRDSLSRNSVSRNSVSRNSVSRNSSTGNSSSRSSLRTRESTTTTSSSSYSSYNLYLVYLALLDLGHAVLQITLCATELRNEEFYWNFYSLLVSPWSIQRPPADTAFNYAYVLGNLWINVIICHQVLVLLETSHRFQRINQPSLTRVHLQGGGVCLASGLAGLAMYLIPDSLVLYIVFVGGTMVPPIGYVVYASIKVIRNQYFGSVRETTLAFYFFRIVAVFLGCLVPSMGLTAYVVLSGRIGWAVVWSYLLIAIQPILTFGAILTKKDARRYIWDLVTLSYLCGSKVESNGHATTSSTFAIGTSNSLVVGANTASGASHNADIDDDHQVDSNAGMVVAN